MECPYCKKEMKEGILSGDARTAAKCGLSVFTIQAHFCEGCKKMIIDTDVTK